MQVAPGSLNGSSVKEAYTDGTNSCVGPPPGNAVIVPLVCSGNATFGVGPGFSYNNAGTVDGTSYSGASDNQFLDQHTLTSISDVLSGQSEDYSCYQTCNQTYSACGVPIGSFTTQFIFQHYVLDTTPVTVMTVSTTPQ
jgi:hypothetical protein